MFLKRLGASIHQIRNWETAPLQRARRNNRGTALAVSEILAHSKLRRKLEALCSRYGIEYQEQEESYSSKASFYDRDEIPVYNADNPIKHKFSGRRMKRGLYRTKDKHLVSSDINGSANILVKSMHRLDFQRVSSGFLANPLRMKVS